MKTSPGWRMSVWMLSIVLAVCALMVVPAGAMIGAAAGAPASSSGASPGLGSASDTAGASAVSTGLPSSLNSFSSPATGQSHPASYLSSSLSSAKTPVEYAGALTKVANSYSGSSIGGALTALAANIAAGKVSPRSVYLPNLNLLATGPRSPGATVGVGYVSNPAPMGIGDFGLGTSPYVYNTTHFAGSLSLNTANATYPGAYYFIGTANGGYTSPYNFGIQLNTVTSNISVPGNNQTSFWTQNVVTLNGNQIQFEDNVWNFSSGELLPGSIYSGNGTYVEPTFYYDYAAPFTLTFPVTVDLFNNVSVVDHRAQVTFGYRVVDSAGVFTGIYDTVVFNNPWAPMDPPYAPAFQVSGKYTSPLGLDYDAELIFGGPGGGSNAVFNNITGTETLQYSNATSGGWTTVPSAYDFGGDTGETAIGVAETWSPDGTVGLSTGPSLLYGLWNTPAYLQAANGAMEFQSP